MVERHGAASDRTARRDGRPADTAIPCTAIALRGPTASICMLPCSVDVGYVETMWRLAGGTVGSRAGTRATHTTDVMTDAASAHEMHARETMHETRDTRALERG
jgi:hypothetical protein